MKKIFIIDAHWNNRGDEAAIRAMIDELKLLYKESEINIEILFSNELYQFPYHDEGIRALKYKFPRKATLLDYFVIYVTKGRLSFTKEGKEFVNILKQSDIVIHAPGGPSIGEIYKKAEIEYLLRLLLVKRMKKPLAFYAPSMGPFGKGIRNYIRKKVLNYAKLLCVREPISKGYLKELDLNNDIKVTLDSAFQHEISESENAQIMIQDTKLKEFFTNNSKIIGITITDLAWNPKYKNDIELRKNISVTFKKFIDDINNRGYAVIFIPQLFGESNDLKYMDSFSTDKCFVLSDKYDCYFQQFIISKLYAVVGMRYHSNIFSAKMCTPFVSIAYEQKMSGFMKKIDLSEYCLDIKDLSYENLQAYFNRLEENYLTYKSNLKNIHNNLREESYQTTKYIEVIIDEITNN